MALCYHEGAWVNTTRSSLWVRFVIAFQFDILASSWLRYEIVGRFRLCVSGLNCVTTQMRYSFVIRGSWRKPRRQRHVGRHQTIAIIGSFRKPWRQRHVGRHQTIAIIGSLRKPRRERHVGHHQTIALTNKTMKLHVQNAIWLVSPPSSARQREMNIFQAMQRTWFGDVKFSLENSEVNNSGKTRKKIVLDSGEGESD